MTIPLLQARMRAPDDAAFADDGDPGPTPPDDIDVDPWVERDRVLAAADAEAEKLRTPSFDRLRPGGAFILDAPARPVAVWGRDDEVLWASGEPLYIVGPTGTGKTTLMAQVLAGRLGLADNAIGYPIQPSDGRVLYLACDRPKQIARALRRIFGEEYRAELDKRLVVWEGPPPSDLAKHPETLIDMCHAAQAGTVVLDSLKDVAVGISDDEVGAGLNRAVQTCIADSIEVAGLHHQRKGQGGTKPKTLEDVYGSTWITAGAGSVILLWGTAGDLIVELSHLKQPATQIGPLHLEHDHDTGRTSVFKGYELLRALRNAVNGLTAADVARQWFEKEKPTDNERKKAKRALDRLAAARPPLAVVKDAKTGGAGGSEGARYYPVDNSHGDAA